MACSEDLVSRVPRELDLFQILLTYIDTLPLSSLGEISCPSNSHESLISLYILLVLLHSFSLQALRRRLERVSELRLKGLRRKACIIFCSCRALQFPPEGWLRMSINHCGITWITIRPNGRVSLRSLGDTGHLSPDAIS